MAEVKGQGSIIQLEKDKPKSKCRKWQLRASVGMDPRTGKYKTRTRRFSGTYTQAKAALREFIAEIEDNRVHVRAGTTFEECAEDFMARRIAYAEVTTIETKTLQDMYAAMRKGDTKIGKPASGTYLHLLHHTISLLMEDLLKDGVITENPCKKMSTPPRDTKEKRALKPAQIRGFIEALDVESENDCGYFLAIALGLRRAEVVSLS